MKTVARDLMQPTPVTVSPRATLAELDRIFTDYNVGAVPVLRGNELVGFVTRTDIVRKLCIEQSLAEVTTANDHDVSNSLDAVEAALDARLGGLVHVAKPA